MFEPEEAMTELRNQFPPLDAAMQAAMESDLLSNAMEILDNLPPGWQPLGRSMSIPMNEAAKFAANTEEHVAPPTLDEVGPSLAFRLAGELLASTRKSEVSDTKNGLNEGFGEVISRNAPTEAQDPSYEEQLSRKDEVKGEYKDWVKQYIAQSFKQMAATAAS